MKSRGYLLVLLVLTGGLTLQSCGPIVISSRPEQPFPPWFYPNRVEVLRYVYFPDYMIYYDLSLRTYIYLENNVWVRVKTLPPRFNTLNLNRSRFVRVKTYRGDDIGSYHSENYTTRNPSNTRSTSGRRN